MDTLKELGIAPTHRKTVLILTGPPGAGKSTWAEQAKLPTYDENLGNKALWRDHKGTDPIILVTAAPDADAKEYWRLEARRFGFEPHLLVMDPGRSISVSRLLRREFTTSDGHRRRLAKTVQRWYSKYSTHPQEIKVNGR